MEKRSFTKLLDAKWVEGKFLCVALDPDLEKMPEHLRTGSAREMIVRFNRELIHATKDVLCAIKINPAFYEPYGDEGIAAIRETIQYIHENAEGVAVVYDAKRADIGNSSIGYAAAAFDHLRADAITVHPYLGEEALEPFLSRAEKGVIVLCRTSNEGGGEFQDLTSDGEPLYIHVAHNVATKWNRNGNCALVVGATYPEEMVRVRTVAPDLPFLIPGIGAQGGDLEKTVSAGKSSAGAGMLITVGRAIIYASRGEDFASAAGAKAQEYDGAIKKALYNSAND